MENASKALIIAGSIIISLVIVSLGIMIYRKVTGATDVSAVNRAQVEAYNSEFEAYFGEYVSAANVKALLQKIKTNNTLYTANGNTAGDLLPIYITGDGVNVSDKKGKSDGIGTMINYIKSSKHYKVSVENDTPSSDETTADAAGYHSNGYIKTITITTIGSKPAATGGDSGDSGDSGESHD